MAAAGSSPNLPEPSVTPNPPSPGDARGPQVTGAGPMAGRRADSARARLLAVAIVLMVGAAAAGWGGFGASKGSRIWGLVGLGGAAVSLLCGLYLALRVVVPLRRLKDELAAMGGGSDEWWRGSGALGELAWVAMLWGEAMMAKNAEKEELSSQLDDLEVRNRLATFQRRRAQAILDSLLDAVVILDPSGQVTFANRTSRVLVDGDPQDAVGKPAAECFKDEGLVGFLSTVVADGQVDSRRSVEFELNGAAETRVLRASACQIKEDDGDMCGHMIVFRDVTGQKASEETRSRLVRSVSKEVMRPLGDIRARSDWLRNSAKEHGDAVREAGEAIRDDIEEISKLMEDLRNITEIELGHHMLHRTAVRLDRLLRDVTELIRPQAAAKKIEWRLALPEQLRALDGDPDMIKVLILNILTNAVKFTPDGGSVTVDVREDGNFVVMTVRDTGIGIADEDLLKVFDKFYRAEQVRSMNVPGSGLGLTLARQIAIMHDGDIRVSSRVGQGSEFAVYLSRSLASQAAESGAVRQDAASSRG